MNQLTWLQSWFLEQCDGEWEHSYGVRVDTLDNPGWSLEIDLAGTALQDAVQSRRFDERSENDWISYEINEGKFQGYGGPANLTELMDIFQEIWNKRA